MFNSSNKKSRCGDALPNEAQIKKHLRATGVRQFRARAIAQSVLPDRIIITIFF